MSRDSCERCTELRQTTRVSSSACLPPGYGLSMHWWDRLPSLPDALVDWAQVGGTVLSLVALLLALFAIYKAKTDLAVERRRQHELDVLREIGSKVPANFQLTQNSKRELNIDFRGISAMLLMLPGCNDFPITRAALRARASDHQLRYFESRLQVELAQWSNISPVAASQASRGVDVLENRLGLIFNGQSDQPSIFHEELDEAVARRN
jgi:hypothetical protein